MGTISAEEINYLIYRYLQESGFVHSAFTFAYESLISKSVVATTMGGEVPPGTLIAFLQKGLQMMAMEHHLNDDGSEVVPTADSPDFSLLTPFIVQNVGSKPLESKDALAKKAQKAKVARSDGSAPEPSNSNNNSNNGRGGGGGGGGAGGCGGGGGGGGGGGASGSSSSSASSSGGSSSGGGKGGGNQPPSSSSSSSSSGGQSAAGGGAGASAGGDAGERREKTVTPKETEEGATTTHAVLQPTSEVAVHCSESEERDLPDASSASSSSPSDLPTHPNNAAAPARIWPSPPQPSSSSSPSSPPPSSSSLPATLHPLVHRSAKQDVDDSRGSSGMTTAPSLAPPVWTRGGRVGRGAGRRVAEDDGAMQEEEEEEGKEGGQSHRAGGDGAHTRVSGNRIELKRARVEEGTTVAAAALEVGAAKALRLISRSSSTVASAVSSASALTDTVVAAAARTAKAGATADSRLRWHGATPDLAPSHGFFAGVPRPPALLQASA